MLQAYANGFLDTSLTRHITDEVRLPKGVADAEMPLFTGREEIFNTSAHSNSHMRYVDSCTCTFVHLKGRELEFIIIDSHFGNTINA